MDKHRKRPEIGLSKAVRSHRAAVLMLEAAIGRIAKAAISAALADFDFEKVLPPTNKLHPKIQQQPTNPKRRS